MTTPNAVTTAERGPDDAVLRQIDGEIKQVERQIEFAYERLARLKRLRETFVRDRAIYQP